MAGLSNEQLAAFASRPEHQRYANLADADVARYYSSGRYYVDLAASRNLAIGADVGVRAPVGPNIHDVFVEPTDVWFLDDTYETRRRILALYQDAPLTESEVRQIWAYVNVLNRVIDDLFASYYSSADEPEDMRELIAWEHRGIVLRDGEVMREVPWYDMPGCAL